jgi:hypothetical protein
MRSFRRESMLYALALALGIGVRFVGLGAEPLNDLEAKWALQALGVAGGAHAALGSQTLYVLLTSVVFYAYGGSTNALARLVPALAGSAMVLLPALFRERLKPRPTLILAFLIAFEPGMVALSRQVGTSILTLATAFAAWGLWERGRFRWSGVCAGLALLSGPALWVGLLGLGLAWAIWQPFRRIQAAAGDHTHVHSLGSLLSSLWFAVGTVAFVGTLAALVPSGVSAWLAGLPEYIRGWVHASNVSAGLMSFSIVAYQPVGLLLAGVAIIRGWRGGLSRIRFLSIWMGVAFLLSIFYPDRQITDLGWALIPLWALASLELAYNLNVRRDERREVLGTAALVFLILVFVWLDFLGFSQFAVLPDQAAARIWLMFGSLLLLVLSLLLVAAGWSARVARFGTVWGLVGTLSVYSFAASMGAAGLRQMPDAVEMWRPGGTLPQAGLLLGTVQDMSDWSDYNADSQPVTIAGIDSPALRWLLRQRAVHVVDAVGPAVDAPMVLTVDRNDPDLAARYRGEAFALRRIPLWEQTGLSQWLDWLSFHQVPQQTETVILWVRSDLFLNAKATP